ncbi:MAG: DUF881 domain-containing protein [Nocardioides sp.]|nr:DUF881 domain-containing protein [Nocardioides sp.]
MPDRADLPPRVTLPLLDLVTRQSLDEDYLVAAERRAQRAPATGTHADVRPGSGRRRRVAAIAVMVFGIMASTAAVQTQQNASATDEGRATLLARIDSERERGARLQELIADLREQNAEGEQQALALNERQQTVTARLRRLQVRTGFVAVRGEGVRVMVTDEASGTPDGAVKDEDLALLVDGLWAAGAEAISVNGLRLTAMSAIRVSGAAIEVNGVGIASPYTVLAVGDKGSLQANFYDTSSGLAFSDLSRRYGFEFDMDNEDELLLPSARPSMRVLRWADEGSSQDESARKPEEVLP